MTWFGGDLEDHLIPIPLPGKVTFSLDLLKALSSLVWNTSRGGVATVSLGSLLQCFPTLLFIPDV